MTLQDELYQYCTRYKVTHYAVAKAAEVPVPYVYQIKRGREDRVPLKARIRIAEYIGLDWQYDLVVPRDNGRFAVPKVGIVYKGTRGYNG